MYTACHSYNSVLQTPTSSTTCAKLGTSIIECTLFDTHTIVFLEIPTSSKIDQYEVRDKYHRVYNCLSLT